MSREGIKAYVGLNAHLLSSKANYRSAGVSRYIQALLTHLPQVDDRFQYVAFMGTAHTQSRGWHICTSPWPTERPVARILWEQTLQPWAAHREKLDLLHQPVYVGPLLRTCPTVVTLHDLSFYLYPELFPRGRRIYLQHMTQYTVEHAQAVITGSESSKRDALRLFTIPEEKITVIPDGVEPRMKPLHDPAAIEALRQRYHLPSDMLLFLGTLEPRKNIITLLEAYALLRQRTDIRHGLVVAGGRGWYYDEIYAMAKRLGLQEAVQFTGYVPDEELPLWYNAADLFVYPSLYEGFGLPPLEAMACGTPVITSNTSSLPEIVGDGGLTVDPHDPQALAEAIYSVLSDPAHHERLAQAARSQASRFSWRTTAARTAQLYHRVLEGDDVKGF
ncbi:MAG: glycosyltransferase family 1 protein [Chloroflexota bacterium]|nr:glycosyltransferase family 1 protein [Chloroflexota bacterium]